MDTAGSGPRKRGRPRKAQPRKQLSCWVDASLRDALHAELFNDKKQINIFVQNAVREKLAQKKRNEGLMREFWSDDNAEGERLKRHGAPYRLEKRMTFSSDDGWVVETRTLWARKEEPGEMMPYQVAKRLKERAAAYGHPPSEVETDRQGNVLRVTELYLLDNHTKGDVCAMAVHRVMNTLRKKSRRSTE